MNIHANERLHSIIEHTFLGDTGRMVICDLKKLYMYDTNWLTDHPNLPAKLCAVLSKDRIYNCYKTLAYMQICTYKKYDEYKKKLFIIYLFLIKANRLWTSESG